MPMRRVVFTLFVLLAGCSVVDPAAQVRMSLDAQAWAWSRGDLDGFMAGYWKNDDLTFVAFPRAVDAPTTTQPSISRGWQTVHDRFRKRYADKAAMGSLVFRNIDVKMVARDTALVTGRYEVERGTERLTGFFVLDMVRMKDGWKIVRDRTYPD